MFDLVCDLQNLADAYRRARKGLRNKTDANIFAERFEYSLRDMQRALIDESYEFGPYSLFKVRDPKDRNIFVAPFRDRIVHHAVNHHIEPVFERSFIEHSYACRKGKGNRAALKRLQHWLDGMPHTYVLKMDIKKYFASVDRSILLTMIHKKIVDAKVLRLLDRLIWQAPFERLPGKGLPIGNLTSQTMANLYLNSLDHYAKDYLGTRHYIRYVDDFIILGDKKKLHELRAKIVDFLDNALRLQVEPAKEKVLAVNNGIPFLGFVLRPNKQARIQHQAVQRFLWKLKASRQKGLTEPELAEKVISWFSYAKSANVHQVLTQADAQKYVDAL